MPLYTAQVLRLPYPPHSPCREHEDCEKNAELAESCAMATEPKSRDRGVAVFAFRKVDVSRYYTPGQTEPDAYHLEQCARFERCERTGQITYTDVRHTERIVFESYAGSVVRLWSDTNARIMSDVWGTVHYADVITDTGEPLTIIRGDSEFGTGDAGGLEDAVDVTPEALERHRLFLLRQSIALETEAADRAAAKIAEEKRQAAADAIAPKKGARVKVIGARGKGAPPKGSIGECFWVGESTYRHNRFAPPSTTKRVGLVVNGVKYFTAASNVVLA